VLGNEGVRKTVRWQPGISGLDHSSVNVKATSNVSYLASISRLLLGATVEAANGTTRVFVRSSSSYLVNQKTKN
jgi:hypothetical protein